MAPKRKEPTSKSDELTDKRRDTRERSLTPPLPSIYDKSDEEEEESDDTASLNNKSEEEEADEEEEEAEEAEEEEQLSQEEEDFFSLPIFQGNEYAERKAIDELVSDVEASQSQGELPLYEEELSQSQSQVEVAIASHNCTHDEAQEVQALENRLINPIDAGERIAQLYLELLRSTGENIEGMIRQLKLAIQTMMTSTTATAMFEQINEHVVPLVRTVATTCVGYYLGSYLLRYVGGIINYLLDTNTTITLISLGSAGVHIVYSIGTPGGGHYLDQVVAAANANIETFLTGVSRISNVPASVHETMLENTLAALTNNVQQAINEAREEQQKGEMIKILEKIDDLAPDDSEFQIKIKAIQDRLNKLMAPVEVDNDGDGDHEHDEEGKEGDEHFGGKRVKRNKTKKTKAKKTVKRKAKKVKKTKKAKKAKKTVKRKAKKAKST